MARRASTMKWNSHEGCALFLLLRIFLLLSPSLSPVHGAELLNHVSDSGICRSLDIRNNVNAFEQLEGCQVIEGSLQILLIDNGNEADFAELSFPELVEITGYLLLFRVIGLRSIGQLFPNLAVIRGQHLFTASKALVIYEMASLQEIGLHSLTKIMNGYIHIEKNPSLCFVHSIDWNKIINATENDGNLVPYIKSDKPQNECPVCPSTVNGVACPRSEKDNNKFLCWNRNHCQKICYNCPKSSCNDKGECCDDNCVGGCGTDVTKCKACQDFVFGTNDSSKCVQSCPSNFLAYLDRRCITRDECTNMVGPILFHDTESDINNDVEHPFMVHEGKCVLDCPLTYSLNYTSHTCVKCNNTCRKECKGGRIDNINLAGEFKGCTHITGNIEIQIRGGSQVVKVLEENLGRIEEIEGYLKVVRSYSLVSLNFLKSLKYIHGKQLENHRYSLIALDNQNLQDLFDWDTHKEFRIFNGSLYFHFNSKLCIEKIDELRRKAELPPYKETEVATNSNGDKVACNISDLEVKVAKIYSKSVVLEWSRFAIDDPRKLLSYIVSSIEAPNKTVNFFDGRDACGQDNWNVDDVPNNPYNERINHTLSNLKPFTQYAFFVKTYTIASQKNGAQSKIIYFKTKAAQPSAISVSSTHKTSNSLSIKWPKPTNPNGIISYYIITGRKQQVTPISEKDRDYCREAIVPESSKKTFPPFPKIKPQECSNSQSVLGSKILEIDVEDRENGIDFENALHNKVYVKRPKISGRSKRDIPFTAKDSPNGTLFDHSLDIPSYVYFDNGTISSDIVDIIYANTTEQNTNFWEQFTYFVKEPTTSLEIDNLHHFTGYNIAVRACRQPEENDVEPQCGEYLDVGEFKTLEKRGADNIHNASILNITSDSVTVRWALPPDPNRKIVAVTIHYRREGTKNSQYLGECIPFKDFNFTKDGRMIEYTIPKLFPGNHSLYLRATSLFGVGDPSPILSFIIPESGPDTVLIVALVLTFLFMGIFGGLWWFYRRTMRERYLLRLIPSVNPDYLPSVYMVDEWEVPRKNVELIKELGQGSFGMVWEGFGHDFKDVKGTLRCAVKTVNEHATRRERIDFLNEASVMKAFNTSHVVKLMGVVSQGQPALVIMELMVNGDLKTYLRSHRPENNDGKLPPTLKRILQMAIEIADGMAYLESKKFVHRDLAARNCMVAEDLTVKIGDFGMTRDIYETDYYRKGTRGLLPVRWMSPESLKDGVFSSSSDVWSYGVVLWEMATLASQPYQGLSNEQVLRYIMEGGLMERPENCPDKLYEIMKICWDLKPGRRPTFMKLCEILLPEANERFFKISFYHSEEGAEARAIRAAANASAEITVEDVGEDVEEDASTPLNALPPDVRIVGTYGMSNSDRSESIQSVHIDQNPRFYSISEEHTANGYITASRIKNGKAQSQC